MDCSTFVFSFQSINQLYALLQELIPLRRDLVGTLPATFEEEMQDKVTPELWAEYLDLKEKISKRDTYLKTIIDTERAVLQEINCIINPR